VSEEHQERYRQMLALLRAVIDLDKVFSAILRRVNAVMNSLSELHPQLAHI
jgi:hypothetical protein